MPRRAAETVRRNEEWARDAAAVLLDLARRSPPPWDRIYADAAAAIVDELDAPPAVLF